LMQHLVRFRRRSAQLFALELCQFLECPAQ
jgi:hypothetical protein